MTENNLNKNELEYDKVSWLRKQLIIPILLLVCSIGLPSSCLASQNRLPKNRPNVATIKVEVDPRVELIGIVFRLAGSPEYNQGGIRSYVKDVERHFGDFDGHPVVKMAATLRNTHLMSADGPMSLSVYIDRDFRPQKTFEEWPWGLDYRWERQETKEFIEKLQQFATDTKFNEFFKAHGTLYEKGIRSCEALLAQHDLRTWLDEFFGVDGSGDLRLVLGFVNGPNNYGLRFTAGKTHEKYAVIGVHLFDPDGNPVFRPKQLATTTHEFCHSFANPIVDKYMEQLQPAGEKLYAAHASAMQRIGYQNWKALVYESAVRACVASFIRNSFPPEVLQYYLTDEASYGFVWTKELSKVLLRYEGKREKYPTFESFFPEIVVFFNDYSEKENL